MKKKLIVLLLVLVLSLSVFVSCSGTKLDDKVADALLKKVKMVFESAQLDEVDANFELPSKVVVGDNKATIKWTSSDAENIQIGEAGTDGYYPVTVNQQITEDVDYVLTATLVDEEGNPYVNGKGDPVATTFDCTLIVRNIVEMGAIMQEPEMGSNYLLAMYQKQDETYYYATGKMSGYYVGSTDIYNGGVRVTLEESGDGFHLSFNDGGSKKYFNAQKSGSHNNLVIGTSAVTVWTWDTENKAIVTNLEGTDVYIGTYGSYNTFGLYLHSKVTDASSYPAYFAEYGEIVVTAQVLLDRVQMPSKIYTKFFLDNNVQWTLKDDSQGLTMDGSWAVPTRGDADQTATLVASATVGGVTETKEFVVTIPKAVNIDLGTLKATLDFSDTKNRTSVTTAKQVWTAQNITMTNEKGASTNDVKDYADPVRLYSKSSLKIEYTGMTAIKITCAIDTYTPTDYYRYAKSLDDLYDNTTDNITYTRDANVIYIQFSGAVNEFSFAEIDGQMRIETIEIY